MFSLLASFQIILLLWAEVVVRVFTAYNETFLS